MAKQRELHIYDYVNQPYEAVRDALYANPRGVFRAATAANPEEGVGGGLHAQAGPLEIAAAIAIEVRSIEPALSPNDEAATKLVLEWRAFHRAELFPTIRATLLVYGLSATETQLEFVGHYVPPMGVVGAVLDATAMRGVAKQAIANFVHDVAGYLSRMPSSNAAQGTR